MKADSMPSAPEDSPSEPTARELPSPESRPPEAYASTGTLEAFEWARRYNAWIFSRVRRFTGNRVVDVGAGIGNLVYELLKVPTVQHVVATDSHEEHLAMLMHRHADDDRLTSVLWDTEASLPSQLEPGSFDTVLCSNVLEHIGPHESALRSMRNLLRPGGHLLLLVPANPKLFCALDTTLEHHRRYRRRDLWRLLEATGFKVDELFPHNFLGSVGWYWRGKLQGQERLRGSDIRLFDRLVPALRPLDPLLARLFGGVSWIAIARKPE